MTEDDIIRIAREAGFEILEENEIGIGDGFHTQTDLVERFAKLVSSAERDACAKVCDEIGDYAETEHVNYPHWTPWGAARECALKIRLKEKA